MTEEAQSQWTFLALSELEYGHDPYLGARWMAAARGCLEDIRRQWPEIKSDAQRRDCEAGVQCMIDLIKVRKNGTYQADSPKWDRFRAECDQLADEWNDLWFFGVESIN